MRPSQKGKEGKWGDEGGGETGREEGGGEKEREETTEILLGLQLLTPRLNMAGQPGLCPPLWHSLERPKFDKAGRGGDMEPRLLEGNLEVEARPRRL